MQVTLHPIWMAYSHTDDHDRQLEASASRAVMAAVADNNSSHPKIALHNRPVIHEPCGKNTLFQWTRTRRRRRSAVGCGSRCVLILPPGAIITMAPFEAQPAASTRRADRQEECDPLHLDYDAIFLSCRLLAVSEGQTHDQGPPPSFSLFAPRSR